MPHSRSLAVTAHIARLLRHNPLIYARACVRVFIYARVIRLLASELASELA